MAFIQHFIDEIRKAKKGREVRGSLADGIDAINKETESTTTRQKNLDATFKQLIINAGESNAEIVAGRHDNTTGTTYDSMPDRLDATSEQLITTEQILEKAKQSRYGYILDSIYDRLQMIDKAIDDKGLDVSLFKDKTGQETSIVPAIKRAYTFMRTMTNLNTLFFTDDVIDIDEPLVFDGTDGRLNLITNGGLLKCSKEGLENLIQINNARDFTIQGFIFDDDLKGRTIIDLNNCSHFRILNNKFLGYTAEHGYYQTDSAIRVSDSYYGVISENFFKDFGSQYDTATETLNRCITLNGTTDGVLVVSNEFVNVNQAIVVAAGCSNIISNNIFDNVRDNCVYAFGNGLIITSNVFRNRNDEAIVIAGSNYTIVANIFEDIPNKIVAFTGNTKNVIFAYNIGVNFTSAKIANIMETRDKYKIENITIEGNIIDIQENTFDYDLFRFLGDVIDFKISGNTIKVKTYEYQKILVFSGNQADGMINDNIFSGTDLTTEALVNNATGGTIYYKNNIHRNCRVKATMNNTVIRDYIYQTNAGPFALNPSTSRSFEGDSSPTIGTWKQGDFIKNRNPSSTGVYGWVCVLSGTPGVWETIDVNVIKFLRAQEDWKNFTSSSFGFNWSQKTGDELQYYKDKFGRAYIRGAVTGGQPEIGTRITTLDEGYRPSRSVDILAKSGTNLITLSIETTGNIIIKEGNPTSEIKVIGEPSFRV
ncbi:hypothetical protein [Niallia circulans]|uniref:hypothetical protein n=1 Tax=Niallia circulans TaxID=1397 RepID=UPI003525E373